jgi:mono/diheme cytochrome c family protein
MIKTIAKWTGIVLAILVGGIAITTILRQHLTYDAPYPEITASTDSGVISRGRHLVYGPGHCVDCHSVANADSILKTGHDVPLIGGFKFDLPVGVIYSKNITPDPETGIGKFSDREIARALRYGVHPNGEPVYDFMPFHNTSDEDLQAIISFLRSQPAVKNSIPENDLNILGNIVKAYMIKPVGPTGEVPKSVKADSSAEYGHYLAHSVANCVGCHTKRDISGAYTGEPFAGGGPMEERLGTFIPPNLTQHPSGRIYGWSSQQFIERFRKGRQLQGSPMPWNSFQRMSDTELTAIYNYLVTIKPTPFVADEALAKK